MWIAENRPRDNRDTPRYPAADWPKTGKTSTATPSPSSSSPPSASCHENSVILYEVSGRTLSVGMIATYQYTWPLESYTEPQSRLP